MQVEKTPIEGLTLFPTRIIEDTRGFFTETYRADALAEVLGRDYVFAQGNHSRSRAGTLRGFRAEPWDKLIHVAHGTALIVVVDIRPNSPTFRQHWRGMIGDRPGTRARILVQEGLANAFYCMTEVDYINEVSHPYLAHVRRGFIWNDPTLDIDWPDANPVLSVSDQRLPTLDAMLNARGEASDP